MECNYVYVSNATCLCSLSFIRNIEPLRPTNVPEDLSLQLADVQRNPTDSCNKKAMQLLGT